MMNEVADARVALWNPSQDSRLDVEQALVRFGCTPRRAESFGQLARWVKSQSVDLIVTWLSRDDQSAFELVTWLEAIPSAPPVVIVGRGLDVDIYLEAMRRGAFDCLGLPLDESEFARIVAAAMESSTFRQPV